MNNMSTSAVVTRDRHSQAYRGSNPPPPRAIEARFSFAVLVKHLCRIRLLGTVTTGSSAFISEQVSLTFH